jgi:hypothetical protein
MLAVAVKTTRKTTPFATKMVQKTCKYPMAENQSQSTTKLAMLPSTMRHPTKRMMAIRSATAVPRLNGRRLIRSVMASS